MMEKIDAMKNRKRCRDRAVGLLLVCLLAPSFALTQWVQVETNPPVDGEFVAHAFSDSTTGWFADSRFLVRTTNGGTTWVRQDSLPYPCLWGAMGAWGTRRAVYAAFQWGLPSGGSIRMTTNGGEQWHVVSGRAFYPVSARYLDSLTVLVVGAEVVNDTLYRTAPRIQRSSDAGSTWVEVFADTQDTYVSSMSFLNGQQGWAATVSGTVYVTGNGGKSWSLLSQVADNESWGFIHFFTPDSGWIYSGSCRLSTDGGRSWPFYWYPSPVWGNISMGTRLVGWANAAGIKKTTDGGATWVQQIYDPYMSASISAVDSLVCWALTNRGVFRTTSGGGFLSVEDVGEHPSRIILFQNYPNPFNPTTAVSYQLSVVSNVKLVVYDLLGREVAVLVNQRNDAGLHEVRFNASGLSSGVYVYRLTAGRNLESRKMMLVR